MKRVYVAAVCMCLLFVFPASAKAQDQETRIKQLEDRLEALSGDLIRIREEYDKKLKMPHQKSTG